LGNEGGEMSEETKEGKCEFWTKAKLFRTPSFIEYHTLVCRRPKMENSPFCVFHTPVEHKRPEDFWFEFFKEQREIKRFRIRGSTWQADYQFKDFLGFEFPDLEHHFWNVVFDTNVRFDSAKFRGPAIFNNVTFKKEVSFENAEFHEMTIFLSPVFEDEAEFEGAVFKDPRDPKFRGVFVPLTGCTFNGKTSFKKTVFETGVDFTKSVFKEEVVFDETDFSGMNYFVSVTFEKGASFRAPQPVSGEKSKVFFVDVKTITGAELIFKDINLSGWAFARTRAVEEAILLNVDWEDKNVLPRKHTWDEILAGGNKEGIREPITYDDAAEVYRRLRLNYEKRLAYEAASDFHIGQMEMLYKNPDTGWWKRRFLWLYRTVSNFGESVKRPIFWFLGVWGFFTLVWFSQPAIPSFEEILRGDFISPWNWARFEFSYSWFIQSLSIDWVEAAIYTWNSIWRTFVTFITGATPKGGSFFKVIAALQRIVGVSVATLFILALRRAFRR
jgi:hypothetical protein